MHLIAIVVDGYLGKLAFAKQALMDWFVEISPDGLRELSLLPGTHHDQAYAVQLFRHSEGAFLIEVVGDHHRGVEFALRCI